MSSASLTSTEAVKHSNYQDSDRRGATTTTLCNVEAQKEKHTIRVTHILTLTMFLTNAHRHTKKIYSNKAKVILQQKKKERVEIVAIASDRGR